MTHRPYSLPVILCVALLLRLRYMGAYYLDVRPPHRYQLRVPGYRFGGSAYGLSRLRYLISRAYGLVARAMFPIRLRHISDVGSGFFALRRDQLDLAGLNPIGFKLLAEILIRMPDIYRGREPFRFTEVAYLFHARKAGASKATIRQGLLGLRHLWLLRRNLSY